MEMIEAEDDDDLPLQPLTSEFDLNDNTRYLAHHIMEHNNLKRVPNEDQCITKMVGTLGSPHHCSRRSSTVSDNAQQVPGLLYSPEDTLNNDFFYDDEFAVQFDANLGGMDEEFMDSVDLNALLDLTEDDNRKFGLGKMSHSKSDSCLYQTELELSGGSEVNGSSSDRELTSSDMSDFKAGPLFSPPPPHEDVDTSCLDLHSDSLMCNEELAGSLVKDEDRFAFDWTANKDRYVISFDRSPTKCSSDEGSYHEPPPKKPFKVLTSWGNRSSSSGSSAGPCSSNTSGSAGVSSNNSGSACSNASATHRVNNTTSGSPRPESRPGSSHVSYGSSGSIPTSPFSHYDNSSGNGNDSARPSSTDTSTSSTMTTWKLVKQQKRDKTTDTAVPEGMTTWQKLKENDMSGSKTRSKSMPDLQPPMNTESALMRADVQEEQRRTKRYSANSLLEIYRRMKSLPADFTDCEEPALIEHDDTLRKFETDVWSVSPCSSHQMSPGVEHVESIGRSSLMRWNTMADLNNEPDNTDMCTQVGSIIQQNENDVGVQFPPKVNECGIQTSIEECSKVVEQSKVNKSLQTSLELHAGGHIIVRQGPNKGVYRRKRPHSTGSTPNRRSTQDDRFTVQLSKERMTRSLFFNSTALPDLSFLNKDMFCSISNITQAIKATGLPPKPPMRRPTSSQTQTDPVVIASGLRRSHPVDLSTDYRPKKPPRQSRPHSACIAQLRDTSIVSLSSRLRSRSSDSASSFCSSSSSGIDPGSYESQINKAGHSHSDHRRENYQNNVKIIHTKGVEHSAKKINLQGHKESPKVCNICRAQYSSTRSWDDREKMTASHPVYRKPEAGEEGFSSWSGCECHKHCACNRLSTECCHQIACWCRMDCFSYQCNYSCHPVSVDCSECQRLLANRRGPNASPVRRKHMYHINNKPLKSCLVKRRKGDRSLLAFKHRSWSDPSDGLVLKYSQNGEIKYQLVTQDKDCGRRQPLVEIEVENLDAKPKPEVQEQLCIPDLLAEHLNITSTDSATPESRNMPKQVINTGTATPCSPQLARKEAVMQEKKQMTAPTNSPDQIPIPACTCGTTHAILHSSSDSGEGSGCCDIYRSKKSVSFSENISYHSPHHSPYQSPRRQVRPLVSKDTGTGVVIRHPLGKHLSPKKRPVSLPPDFRLMIPSSAPIPEDPESPPRDFMVSPPSSMTLTPSPPESFNDQLAARKELVRDMMKATEVLLHYFSQTHDPNQKAELASSSHRAEIGHLVLQHVCPVVYAIVLDGLKPHVRSLFGRVKNSAWRVVEDSVDLGPTSRVIRELVQDLKTLDFLTTAWLKFNAFVFGLLNHQALDLWLSQLQSSDRVLSKHYDPDSFFQVTTTLAAKPLFLDLITVIQPLAQMPFRLEYNFEFRQLEGKQHQQLSDYMLDRHVSRSGEGRVEGQQWRLYQNRLQQLSQDSASPVRGEISPVQGEKGQQKLVLHHSSPAGGQASSSKPHNNWHSLYDKVQKQLKDSHIAKQTKTLVADTSKQLWSSLKDSKKLVSKDALQNLGQDLVMAAVGYSSPVKALPSIPGLTRSEEDNPSQSRNSRQARKLLRQRKAMSLVETSSDEERETESLVQRMTLRLFSSPQKAYKTGITDYQFAPRKNSHLTASKSVDVPIEFPNSAPKSKSLDDLNGSDRSTPTGISPAPLGERPRLFDEHGSPTSSSLEHPPVEFRIPSRGSSIDETGSPPSERTTTPDTVSSTSTASLTHRLGTSLKKSWSSFGPSLVGFVDKLLLEDPQKKSPTKSCGTVKPNFPSPTKTASTKPSLQRSATIATCQDLVSEEEKIDLGFVQGLLGTGKVGVVEVGNDATCTGSGKAVVESYEKPQKEHNWFVAALCHHVAMQDDQLSYDKGAVMAVIRQVDADWLLCRHGKKEGLVHNACVNKA